MHIGQVINVPRLTSTQPSTPTGTAWRYIIARVAMQVLYHLNSSFYTQRELELQDCIRRSRKHRNKIQRKVQKGKNIYIKYV